MKKINLNLFLFFTAFCLICVSLPGKLSGQQVIGVSSLEFHENHRQLLEDGGALIIDGRTATMFASGHLKNAINIDADDPNLVSLLRKHLEEPIIVIYCTTIRRTNKIVNTLRGFYEGEIIYISDGLRGWQQNGLPVTGATRLQLQDAIEEVLENNDRLQSSRMMIESAKAGIDERAAFYKPYVDANFQYAYLDIVPGLYQACCLS